MGFHSEVLDCQLHVSAQNLDELRLVVLCDKSGFLEGRLSDGCAFLSLVEVCNLEKSVLRLCVSGTRWTSDKLGKSAVQRVLPTLEARTAGASASALLTAHSKAAGATLACRVAAALSLLPLLRSWRRLQRVHPHLTHFHSSRFSASLPVEDLHLHARSSARRHRSPSRHRQTICVPPQTAVASRGASTEARSRASHKCLHPQQ
mmetsp:Transcript_4177/g.12561  ORF Transcript_4177/g.12561 Transcript_4177/m.12561 type:complete len:204 (-) Transcript_4177:20-631(-)